MHTISYTAMRQNLAKILNENRNGETVCIRQKGKDDLILNPKTEKLTHQEKVKLALSKIEKRHASVIQALADR
ncbi:type II toxin-antitoxin system Phd/YefM family antitoxin [Legionella jordanis]|uniref:Phd/YefM type II antitoxin n=1 Tax=Legionella jordanis TaxID=456 RepID=A0A0W0VAY9_9GAMM|nr:type II toxin-antitoxin system Phd/YefM family antitoxin [Legionella jordanis]KTD17282.1 Phd/YefM type II antitoxin [Legionella jordanis]RMW99473.1 type II toxin-antitoxin system Phd/YefM family antitoxin [Legionella jordanis]RMX15323.1 type II toxin-antitoxin system Phd/YefM family antitoxin [Legionella jordanis]VEH12519.1 Uncharacterised protein [Legionella jordanis]HAT8715333.1 hypothetical protein [Legionella jordanis]